MPIQASLILSRSSSSLAVRKLIRNAKVSGRICWCRPNYTAAAATLCQPQDVGSQQPGTFVYSVAAFMASVVASLVYYQSTQITTTTWCLGGDVERDKRKPVFRVEVDLMDKIARRPYLQPYNSSGSWHYRGDDDYDGYEIERKNYTDVNYGEDRDIFRPPGVPHTLRILALDMPEMKRAFSGAACFRAMSYVYPSGVAPPKRCVATAAVPLFDVSGGVEAGSVTTASNSQNSIPEASPQPANNAIPATSSTKLEDDGTSTVAIATKLPLVPPTNLVRVNYRVEQKSVAQSLLRCYSPQTDQISVQVLMGSIAQLNPNHVHPSTRRRSNSSLPPHDKNSHPPLNNSEETSIGFNQQNEVAKAYSKIKEELEAPWNQHAWMDELELRISGRVHFGAPMERASSLSRFLGRRNVYQQTIASSRTAFDWFLFPSLQTDPAGMDGKDQVHHDDNDENAHDDDDNDDVDMTTNWASQKPHAVVANGTALREVPGSLRLLQRLCEQEQVPLFIYQDRHAWRGCRVYEDFNELLFTMRQTIQQHVVRKALRYHQQDFLFASGRLLGQVEGEIKCQLKDRMREFGSVLRWYLNLDPSEMDWSKQSAEELDGMLRERKIIQSKVNFYPVLRTETQYNPALVEICKTCVAVHDAETARRRKKWWLPQDDDKNKNSKPGV